MGKRIVQLKKEHVSQRTLNCEDVADDLGSTNPRSIYNMIKLLSIQVNKYVERLSGCITVVKSLTKRVISTENRCKSLQS